MGSYRKKPVIIQAHKIDSGSPPSWYTQAVLDGTIVFLPLDERPKFCVVKTLEGDHIAMKDDWIIKGVHGELYPCKPDIFAETYEQVPEDEDKIRIVVDGGETEHVEHKYDILMFCGMNLNEDRALGFDREHVYYVVDKKMKKGIVWNDLLLGASGLSAFVYNEFQKNLTEYEKEKDNELHDHDQEQ